MPVVAVRVVFFAAARELSGCPELQLSLTSPTSQEQIFAEVSSAVPSLAPLEGSLALALNQTYVPQGDPLTLRAGDELAFIPPISGG